MVGVDTLPLTRVDFNKLHNAWISVLGYCSILICVMYLALPIVSIPYKRGVDSMAYFDGHRRLYSYE